MIVRRKYFCAAICLAMLLLLFAGCRSSRELDALSVVAGIGIDIDEEQPGRILMTAQIARPSAMKSSGGQGGGSEEKAFWNLQYTGDTVFDSIRGYTHETDNKLYIAHNEVIIFGTDAARDGVHPYLDFFLRAQETRPTLKLAVSRSTAADVLGVQPEMNNLPAVHVTRLLESQGFNSQSTGVSLLQFLNDLLSPTTAAVLPLVHVSENDDKPVVHVAGLAVFDEDRMIGELTGSESRGLLWVKGDVQTGIMKIPVSDGIASLEILENQVKAKPEFINGKICIRIEINTESKMVSQTGHENYGTAANLPKLEAMQQDLIHHEILEALQKATQLNADVFGFGELVHKTGIDNWPQIKEQWDDIFPTLEFVLNINSRIVSAGNITRTLLPED